MITPILGPAEVITAGLLHAAGVTVTGVDIDELDTTLTTGAWRGREAAQATARIEFVEGGGTAEPASDASPHRVHAGHGRGHRCACVLGCWVRLTGQLAVAARVT